jgi:Tfp pilus assembly protein PilF
MPVHSLIWGISVDMENVGLYKNSFKMSELFQRSDKAKRRCCNQCAFSRYAIIHNKRLWFAAFALFLVVRALPATAAEAEGATRSVQVVQGDLWENQQPCSVEKAARAYNEGTTSVRESNFGNAVEKLQEAVRHDPACLPAHVNLGFAYTLIGNYENAEKELRSAESIDPAYGLTHLNLAILYMKTGKIDKAREEDNKALKDPRSEGDARISLANIYLQIDNDTKKARDEADKAAKATNPRTRALAFVVIGHTYKKNDKFSEAIPWYEKAIEADPSLSMGYTHLAGCMLISKDTTQDKRIKGLLKKALELNPNDPEAHLFIAHYAITRDDREFSVKEIADHFRKYLELNPSDPNAERYQNYIRVLENPNLKR